MFCCAAVLVVGLGLGADPGAPGIPKEVLEDFAFFAGTWEMDGTIGSNPAEAKFTFTLTPGKHAYTWQAAWKDPKRQVSGVGLTGWDLSEKKVCQTEFWTNGTRNTYWWARKGPVVWEGEWIQVDDKGSVWKGRASVEKKSATEFVFRGKTNNPDDGASMLRFRKVAGK